MQKIYLLFLLAVTLTSACRKGEAPEEHYFGKINVKLINLPDAGKAEVFFESEKMGQIDPDQYGDIELFLPAGKAGKLKIVDLKSSVLIADTNVSVIPNIKQFFRVGYSPTLNIKGFISDTNVPEDSIRVQVFINFKKAFSNYSVIDLHLLDINLEETGLVFKGLKLGDTNPHIFNFPRLGEGDHPSGYFMKLIDPKTGAVIMDASGQEFYPFLFGSTEYYGKYLILDINDKEGNDQTDTYFTVNVVVI